MSITKKLFLLAFLACLFQVQADGDEHGVESEHGYESEHGMEEETAGASAAAGATMNAGAAVEKTTRALTKVTATFSLAEIATHNKVKDCQMILNKNEVFDITPYMNTHPGGRAILLRYCGADGTKQFDMFHKKSVMKKYRSRFLIGFVEGTTVSAAQQQIATQTAKPNAPNTPMAPKVPAVDCSTKPDVDARCNPSWLSYCTAKKYKVWMDQNCAQLCCYAAAADMGEKESLEEMENSKEKESKEESGEKESKEESGEKESKEESGEKESLEESMESKAGDNPTEVAKTP